LGQKVASIVAPMWTSSTASLPGMKKTPGRRVVLLTVIDRW